ncbi:MAG: zinc ribbon domain-containing protein [Candidatus Heimdallarchaeota archaeon]
MPSGKLISGILLIAFAIPMIALPWTSVLAGDSGWQTISQGSQWWDSQRGYELAYSNPSPLIRMKVDLDGSGLSNTWVVRLMLYDDAGALYGIAKEAQVSNNHAYIDFWELTSPSVGINNPRYFIDIKDRDNSGLAGIEIRFSHHPLITVIIAPILALAGIVLLFLGRGGGGYSRGRRDPGRVAFGDSAPEPVLGASRPGRGKMKKRKRRKGDRPKARPVGGPKTKATKCSQCGANVPAGQMYCPSCYARV